MTRQEQTGQRSLDFSAFIRKELPDSNTGYIVTDVDFILANWKTKKFMLLETKIHMGSPNKAQRAILALMHHCFNRCDNGYQYLGCGLIQFEHTNFGDGKCYFNRKEITEDQLIQLLSF